MSPTDLSESLELLDRRDFLGRILALTASYWLLGLGFSTKSFAKAVKPIMASWLKELTELCNDLYNHQLSATQWQQKVSDLYSRIELADLLEFIDFDQAMKRMKYPEDRAGLVHLQFPRISGLPPTKGFGKQIFGMKKGRAIVPHAHNNMVSAHLIVRGRVRVRTFNRKRDEKDALVITPSIDREYKVGDVLTMSEEKDNIHWLVATTEYAATFDIPAGEIDPGKLYATKPHIYNMIFVDPLGPHLGNGEIRAPIISPEQAYRKFGSADV